LNTRTAPTLDEIRAAQTALQNFLNRTPTQAWHSPSLREHFEGEVYLKLELFQRTGSFKARGALNNVLALSDGERAAGITAMSAGNHAIAAAYAAACFGIDAKVVMQASANPARIEAARRLGAEVIMAKDGATGFAMVDEIVANERRVFVHPFDGPRVAAATAGVGMELLDSTGTLDAVVVPIGGGGLCGGVAAAVKSIRPESRVYGVEPEGAAVMQKSFDAGSPQTLSSIDTIADSLGPPMTTEYPFSLCRRFLDGLVQVSDDQLAAAITLLCRDMKLAVEPAGAATTAALLGPLRSELDGKRVGLIVSGTNIDSASFANLLERGEQALAAGILS
jgi:threonine dehydratase